MKTKGFPSGEAEETPPSRNYRGGRRAKVESRSSPSRGLRSGSSHGSGCAGERGKSRRFQDANRTNVCYLHCRRTQKSQRWIRARPWNRAGPWNKAALLLKTRTLNEWLMPWPQGLDRGYPSAAGVAVFAELRSAGMEIFKHGCL